MPDPFREADFSLESQELRTSEVLFRLVLKLFNRHPQVINNLHILCYARGRPLHGMGLIREKIRNRGIEHHPSNGCRDVYPK